MTKYQNLSGRSPIVSYQIQECRIIVWIEGNVPYVYSYETAGKANVERMKHLARSGRGLFDFLTRRI